MLGRELRPGRTHCAAVVSNDCEAPAGMRAGGGGFASLAGVHRDELHVCWYCGERVCAECSTDFPELGRACDSHEPEELLAAMPHARR